LFFYSLHDLFDNLDLFAIVKPTRPKATAVSEQCTRLNIMLGSGWAFGQSHVFRVDEMTFYRSFEELADSQVEGEDYRIRIDLRDPRVLILAPHGGRIEPATIEIGEAIAGTNYSFYAFEGLKKDGNNVLHIESHLFDEPRALKAVEKANVVITVHGQIDQKEAFVMTGGLHRHLCLEITRQLEASGFLTRPPPEGLMGTDPRNICNRGKLRQGVQLEVSRKVRDLLKNDRDRLRVFADAVRRAIRLKGW
jgi:phage replication-related protein YjqB (UPF0714/DUF867 family)